MYDRRYVTARGVLLDALNALAEHRERIVVVGAQAVYLHTAAAELTIIPFTQDADLALNPRGLADDPRIEACMRDAGFTQRPGGEPGAWIGTGGVEVDLMVPDSLGGGGRRSARIPPHDRHATRKAHGLEAALVDNDWSEIGALDSLDSRKLRVRVAGPGALLLMKLIKIGERAAMFGERLVPKDALDIYRLLQGVSDDRLVAMLRRLLKDEVSTASAEEAVEYLGVHFAAANGTGGGLLRSALSGTELEEIAPVQTRALALRLLARLARSA